MERHRSHFHGVPDSSFPRSGELVPARSASARLRAPNSCAAPLARLSVVGGRSVVRLAGARYAPEARGPALTPELATQDGSTRLFPGGIGRSHPLLPRCNPRARVGPASWVLRRPSMFRFPPSLCGSWSPARLGAAWMSRATWHCPPEGIFGNTTSRFAARRSSSLRSSPMRSSASPSDSRRTAITAEAPHDR